MSRHRKSWHQHGGLYRPVNDFSVPWVSSPISDIHTPPVLPILPLFQLERSDSSQLVLVDKPSPTTPLPVEIALPRSFNWLPRRLRNWWYARSMANFDDDEISPGVEVELPPERAAPQDWKAWGYYARPNVNGVDIRNSPPSSPGSTYANPEYVIASLVGPRGSPHPERWIRGLEHPSLPPRPTRWADPKPGVPQLFPWELQLNPFFEHPKVGPAPILWDICIDPVYGVLYGKTNATIPLSQADMSQPATWPFVTHFYINAVAEDAALRFPWPIMVQNPRGVKIEDVFRSLFDNFQQFVSQSEFDSWHCVRQRQAAVAYDRHGTDRRAAGEGMKRLDYLGHLTMFRGFEPNPDGEGWMMFVGLA